MQWNRLAVLVGLGRGRVIAHGPQIRPHGELLWLIAQLWKSGLAEHVLWFMGRKGWEPFCICWPEPKVLLLTSLLSLNAYLFSASHLACSLHLVTLSSCGFFLCVLSVSLSAHRTALSSIFHSLRICCSAHHHHLCPDKTLVPRCSHRLPGGLRPDAQIRCQGSSVSWCCCGVFSERSRMKASL